MKENGGFGWFAQAEVDGLRRELKFAQEECLRLKDECSRNDRMLMAECAERDRSRASAVKLCTVLDGVRGDLFEAHGSLSLARAELGEAQEALRASKAELARLSDVDERAFARGRDAAYAEFHPLRARVEFLQGEVGRLAADSAEHLRAANGFRRETLAAEKRMESAEANRLRAEFCACAQEGFVPVSELDVVFSEGAAMGAEAVALDVSQFLGALAETDRRHGCDRCAAALGMVARDVPAVVAAMRAARPGLRRRTAR